MSTTFMTHRNAQSYNAGRFVRDTRTSITPRKKAERKIERFVFAMVIGLSGLACWTAASTLPGIVVAGAPTTQVSA